MTDKPTPPTYCKQCGGTEFKWYGIAAFRCASCGDVAHWLSSAKVQELRDVLRKIGQETLSAEKKP